MSIDFDLLYGALHDAETERPDGRRRKERGMRFRALHRLYAALRGYFWEPCPLCGQHFGGHEWKDRVGKPSTIPAPDGTPGHFAGICPDCTRAGRGQPEPETVIWTDWWRGAS
jgi:hypothetical protein